MFECKYDGFQGLCYVEQGRCRFISRNGRVSRRSATKIAAGFPSVDDVVIDGEVIAADETGRSQFYDLLRRARAPGYAAFDILWLDGADLRPLPLGERRKRLQAILPAKLPIISEALSITHRGHELFELMCSNDLE